MSAPLAATLRLVAITDHVLDGRDALVGRVAAAVRGGATMVQVRLKDAGARELADVARRIIASVSVPVVINDRVDVAMAVGAAGVHVGADDLPVHAVRAIAPAGFIVGASLGSESEAANARGADYAGIGPFFGSTSKLDAGSAIGAEGFAALRAMVAIPCVGIGGITPRNAALVRGAGADGVAAIASVVGAPDPERAARELLLAYGP